jgi:hypothetical protein
VIPARVPPAREKSRTSKTKKTLPKEGKNISASWGEPAFPDFRAGAPHPAPVQFNAPRSRKSRLIPAQKVGLGKGQQRSAGKTGTGNAAFSWCLYPLFHIHLCSSVVPKTMRQHRDFKSQHYCVADLGYNYRAGKTGTGNAAF